MPDVQVSAVAPRVQHVASASVLTYAFPFPVLSENDVAVYAGGALLGSGAYTVAGVRQTSGGTITLAAAPADGQTITILRSRPYARLTDFAEAGQFRAKTVNDELDSQQMQTQQVAEEVGRALRLAPTATGTVDTTLPQPAARRALVFNSLANAIDVTTYDPDATVGLAASADTIAKEARDLAATAAQLASQTGAATSREWGPYTLVEGQQIYPLPIPAATAASVTVIIGGVPQIDIWELDDSLGASLAIRLTPTVASAPAEGHLRAGLKMWGRVLGGIVESAIPSQSIFGRHFHPGAIDLTGDAIATGPAASQLLTNSAGRPVWATPKAEIGWTNVCDHGAVGDDATDDTAAITAAVAAMPNGGALLFPPRKVFRISAAINLNKQGRYFGFGESSSIRLMHPAADGLIATAKFTKISGINFLAGVTRAGGTAIKVTGDQVRISDMRFMGQWTSVAAAPPFGATLTIENSEIYETRPGAEACIKIDPAATAGYDVSIKDVIISNLLTSMPTNGILIVSAGDVSIDHCQILACQIGLNVFVPTGRALASLWSLNTFYDNCGRGVSLGAAGTIVRSLFQTNWFSSSRADHGLVLYTSGSGSIDGTDINNCHVFGNAANGVHVFSPGVRNTRVLGGVYAGNGQSGIAFGTLPTTAIGDFSVQSARIGAAHGFGPNAVGIFVSSSAPNYQILGNDVRGNALANVSGAVHAPPSKFLQNNLGV